MAVQLFRRWLGLEAKASMPCNAESMLRAVRAAES